MNKFLFWNAKFNMCIYVLTILILKTNNKRLEHLIKIKFKIWDDDGTLYVHYNLTERKFEKRSKMQNSICNFKNLNQFNCLQFCSKTYKIFLTYHISLISDVPQKWLFYLDKNRLLSNVVFEKVIMLCKM